MIASSVRGLLALQRVVKTLAWAIVVSLACITIALLQGNITHALETDPDSDGWYNQMWLIQNQVTFNAYLRPGDTVTFELKAGFAGHTNMAATAYTDLGNCAGSPTESERQKLMANAVIYSSADSAIVEDSSGFSLATSTQDASVTNNSDSAATKKLVFVTRGDDNRAMYVKNYKSCSGASQSDEVSRGYNWRIVVRDKSGAVQKGRVWAVGPLKLWQSSNANNAINFNLRYARRDGYRYAVNYPDYQGIYSSFTGSVYGIYSKSDNMPYYKSIAQNQSATYNYSDAIANKAFLFVDCQNTAVGSCPGNVGEVANDNNNGAGGINEKPIAEGTYDINVIEGDKVNQDNTYYDYPARNGGMLTGGTLHIRYKSMQSGRIVLSAKKEDGTDLCTNRRFVVDDSDGDGEMIWNFGARDSGCESGALKDNPVSLSINEKVVFTISTDNRGEMHFIAVDTESRAGGISVATNFDNIALDHDDSSFSNTYCGTRNISSGHHEWTSKSSCDPSAAAGTANSAWGNKRVIQDWLWAKPDDDKNNATYTAGPHYDLTPKTSRNPGVTGVDPGSKISFQNMVANAALMAKASGWKWASYGFVIRGGSSVPSIGGSDYASPGDVCTKYSLMMCKLIGEGGGVTATEDGATTALPDTTFDTTELEYGDYVCSFLAIQNYYVQPPYRSEDDTSSKWRVASPSGSLRDNCVQIARAPRI